MVGLPSEARPASGFMRSTRNLSQRQPAQENFGMNSSRASSCGPAGGRLYSVPGRHRKSIPVCRDSIGPSQERVCPCGEWLGGKDCKHLLHVLAIAPSGGFGYPRLLAEACVLCQRDVTGNDTPRDQLRDQCKGLNPKGSRYRRRLSRISIPATEIGRLMPQWRSRGRTAR